MLKRTLIATTLAFGLTAGGAAQQGVQSTPSLQDRVDALAQQIHRRYRHFSPALESRRAAAEEVLAAWNQVAPEGEDRTSAANAALMADWLDAALRAVMPGGSGELPAAPQFEETQFEEAPLEASVAVEAEPRDGAEAVPADESLPTPGHEAVGPITTATPTEAVTPEPRRSRVKVSDPVVTIDNPYVDDAELEKRQPNSSINPLRTSPGDSKPVESQFAGPRATAKPVVPAPGAAGEMDPSTPQRSKWSQHPSAAPLEWRDPFADDPNASPNPLRSGSRHEARRPEYRLSRSTAVNLRQLSADIRGYNAALRSLQSAVMQLQGSDTAALAAAEQELDRLDERRQFLDLYREGLTPDEERVLPKSPSAEVVRELVRRKTETLTDRASSIQREERRAQQTDWFESF